MNKSRTTSRIFRGRAIALPLFGMAALAAVAQTVTTPPAPISGASTGTGLITPGALPPRLATLEQRLGGRMTTAANAQVSLSGTVTDAAGSRTATIIVQAPGLFSYREGNGGTAITFDGTAFETGSGTPTTAQQPIMESLLADLPDAILLQALNGGGIRTVGSHFRTDDGKTPNYAGPYWTLLEFAPTTRTGLAWGQPLQQELFLAIDEQTQLPAEVRRAVKTASNTVDVTQTQFGNWTQQNGQWFPGSIVRLENGQQTLSFTVSAATTGPASAVSAFQP